jgi:chemotaxis protein MotB
MARKKSAPPQPPTSPGWMTTFGDLMSLLLVFFILLVSFSTMEIVKFRMAMGSLRGGEGVLEPNTGLAAVKETPISPESEEFEAALSELVEKLEELQLTEQVRVYWDKSGVRFVLQDEVLFPPGRAEIQPRYLEVLELIVGVVRTLRIEELQVEGHTDDTPIRTERYPTNWELSTARAVTVLRYLQALDVVPPRRLVAHGYGEYRPYVPNDTPANKAKNRRVEIYTLKTQ